MKFINTNLFSFNSGLPRTIIPNRESIALDFIHRNRTLCFINHGERNKQSPPMSFNPLGINSYTDIPKSKYNSKPISLLVCAKLSEEGTSLSKGQSGMPYMWSLPQPDMFDLNTVNHIAVDWLSHNWYFLDETRELVLLCGYDTNNPTFNSV